MKYTTQQVLKGTAMIGLRFALIRLSTESIDLTKPQTIKSRMRQKIITHANNFFDYKNIHELRGFLDKTNIDEYLDLTWDWIQQGEMDRKCMTK